MKKNITIISSILLILITLISFKPVNAFGESAAYISTNNQKLILQYIDTYLPAYITNDNYNYILYRTPDNDYVLELSEYEYYNGSSLITKDWYIKYETDHYVVGQDIDNIFSPGWDRVLKVTLDNTGRLFHEIMGSTGSIPTDLKQSNGIGNTFIYTNMDIVGGPKNGLSFNFNILDSNTVTLPNSTSIDIYNILYNQYGININNYNYVITRFSNNFNTRHTYNIILMDESKPFTINYDNGLLDYVLRYNGAIIRTSNTTDKSYVDYSIGIYLNTTTLSYEAIFSLWGPTHQYSNAAITPSHRFYPYEKGMNYGNYYYTTSWNAVNGSYYDSNNNYRSLLLATNLQLNGGPYNGLSKPISSIEYIFNNNGLPPSYDYDELPTEPDTPNWWDPWWDMITLPISVIDFDTVTAPWEPVLDWLIENIKAMFDQLGQFLADSFDMIKAIGDEMLVRLGRLGNLEQWLVPLQGITELKDQIIDSELPGLSPIVSALDFFVELMTFGVTLVYRSFDFIIDLVFLLVGSTFTLLRDTVSSFVTMINTLYSFFPEPIKNVANFSFSILAFTIILKIIKAVMALKGFL